MIKWFRHKLIQWLTHNVKSINKGLCDFERLQNEIKPCDVLLIEGRSRVGEIIKIEKLPDSKSNTKIEFKEILAYGDNKMIEVGTPTVQGAKVEANLIKNNKNRTILIFKKRRRQN